MWKLLFQVKKGKNLWPGRIDNWVGRLVGQKMVDEIAILIPMPY
jgi:hypothetical protein